MSKIIPYKGNEPYIFISYSHRDKGEVCSVLERMQRDGYRIWFDEGIDPGTEWDEVIAAHVEECGYFLAFISENYLASDNCKDELNYARDLSKKRLLVYLEDVKLPGGMAMRMNRLQSIYKSKYSDERDFYKTLYAAEDILSFASLEGLATKPVEEEPEEQSLPELQLKPDPQPEPVTVFEKEPIAPILIYAKDSWEFLSDDEEDGFVIDGADNCVDSNIVIPDLHQGKPVTGIDEHAFWNCKELISVTIPDTVTRIGGFAFEGCIKLNTICFSGTVEEWRSVRKEKGWNKGVPKKLSVMCSDGVCSK